jgi:hypothetical protein
MAEGVRLSERIIPTPRSVSPEAQAFLEAMNIEMQQTLISGNSGVTPEEFTGLQIRYSSTSAQNGQNIILGGGSDTDNTSIWLVVWGQNTVHGIYPKGSSGGLSHQDLGEVTLENANGVTGARMQALRDHWKWECGLCLRDWRYVVRIPNIDMSVTIANTTTSPLINLMIKALYRVPSLGMGRPVFYMNRSIKQYLDIQAQTRATNTLQTGNDAAGLPLLTFRGVPIRTCDQILENEALVS